MLVTVIIVVVRMTYPKGVIAGVILSAHLLCVQNKSKDWVKKREEKQKWFLSGKANCFLLQLKSFVRSFDFSVENKRHTINFFKCTIWDDSAVGAVDKVGY